ncbi:MAG: hypothetical protein HYV09_38890 [Deltaproteobacteria bacterium]|nr:hypothetical protein [Deltaproteobacteria bacterium]
MCTDEKGSCSPGAIETEKCVDGRTRTRTCEATCEWGAFGDCAGDPTCTAGKTEELACGRCGKQVRVCGGDGKWSDWSTCSGEGVCAPGAKDAQPCGIGGTKTRTCTTSCAWGDFGVCVGDLLGCTAGASETQACGKCGKQTRVCGADLKWSDWSVCGGEGVCAPATTQEEACGIGGKRSRTCSDACGWGAWGTCVGSKEPTELWVAKVTLPSSGSTSSAPVSIDRIDLATDAVLGSITLPSTTMPPGRPLTLSGGSTSGDGQLLRTANGKYVIIAGYATAAGTADPVGTSTSTVPRVIARIDAARTIDTSTTTTSFSSASIRGAGSYDGTSFYAFGSAGIVYVPFAGAGLATSIADGDIGLAGFFGGELYYNRYLATAATVLFWPVTAPTTKIGATAVLDSNAGGTADPWGMVALSMSGTTIDRIYIADERSSAPGVEQWSKGASGWAKTKTIPVPSSDTIRHVTGYVRGTEVVLFASISNSSSSKLVSWVDAGGTAPATQRVVRTAPSLQVFRGVAFAPQ